MIVSSTDDKLYRFASGSEDGVYATTNELDIGYSTPMKIVLYVDNFVNSGDEVTVYMESDKGNASVEFICDDTDQFVLEEQFDMEPTDKLYMTITFDSGDVRIKKIELYGEPTTPVTS